MPNDADRFDIADLFAFGRIAEVGGLSAASRRFDVSKASLSRSLARLEDAAGAPLFDRIGKGLRLTPLGETVKPIAERTVATMAEAKEAMRTAGDAPRGPLRVAASALSAQLLLVPALNRMAERYPEVEVSLRVSARGLDPVSEDLDMVLRIGRPEEAYLVARRLVRSRLLVYVTARRAERMKLDDPFAVESLGRIVMGIANVPHDWALTNERDETLVLSSPPRAAVGDPSVALAMLRTGTGVAFLPEFYGEELVREGALVRALPEWTGPPIEIYASLPPKRTGVPAVKAFLDLIVTQVAERRAALGL